jgi:lysophospholipase L1-like esterase
MRNDMARRLFCLCIVILTAAPSSHAADEKPPKPPRYEDKIAAFEAADKKTPPPANGVLFIGSSSMTNWKSLEKDFPGIPVFNRGFGGSQIHESTHYADRIVLPYKPKTIVFYAGDNDIAGGKSPEKVFANYQAFVKKVRDGLPDTRILFVSIKPSIARWKLVDKIREANRLIKEFSESDKKLGYIDIFTPMLGADGQPRAELLGEDGLHMTRKGYELWIQKIKPELTEEKAN